MSVSRLKLALVCLLTFTLSLPPAFAAVEIDVEVEEITRTEDIQDEVTAASDAALQAMVLEGARRVTFKEIMEDPDNLDLNLRYAKLQVVQGNLLGASATLERILLIKPDAAPVRLFYAVVLFRLDNLNEASRELEILKDVEMPDALREELKVYATRIKKRRQKTLLTIRQNNGFQFDDNRNSAASSTQRYSNGVIAALSGTSDKRRDTSFINITSLDLKQDLGMQAGHTINTSFTYFTQEQSVADSLDLTSLGYTFGATLKWPWFEFTPTLNLSHVLLSRQLLLRSQGGSFAIKRNFYEGKFGVNAKYKIDRQDYRRTGENPSGEDTEGTSMQMDMGWTYQLRPNMRWSMDAVWSHKSAKKDFNDTDKGVIKGGLTWILGKGQFLINSVEFGKERHYGVDGGIIHRQRRDKTFRYRGTYGAPLALLLYGKLIPKRLVPEVFKDLTLTATYEYNRTQSNITNNQFKNNKYQILMSKTWQL